MSEKQKEEERPGAYIPAPAEFPVTWPDPADAKLLWTVNRVHAPRPMSICASTVAWERVSQNFSRATKKLGLPMRMRSRRINTYLYTSSVSASAPPEPVMHLLNGVKRFAPGLVDGLMSRVGERMMRNLEPRIQAAIGSLARDWEQAWLPEIQATCAQWEDLDLGDAELDALNTHLQDALKRLDRIWQIHFELVFPAGLAMHLFDELCQELLESDDPFVGQTMLQGIDNSFLQADRALWDLAQEAQKEPAVQEALLQDNLAGVPDALAGTEAGRSFQAKLDRFLDQFGRRAVQSIGFNDASWLEDPTPALVMLRHHLQGRSRNPHEELAAVQAGRAQALAAARSKVQQQGQAALDRFEKALHEAETGMYLHEEHNFWIDQRAMADLRLLILALGRRLAELGLLTTGDDIWHLSLDEILALLQGQSLPNMAQTIAARQEEIEKFGQITPPARLGRVPLMQPPRGGFMQQMMAALGGKDRSGEEHAANELLGTPGSPGTIRAQARVVQSLEEAQDLQKGEIMIARTTMPPWTPFFGVAVGLVTETGGMLSHAAVVAREHGIPAVVGVPDATHRIRTGSMVEIDGNAGSVRML